MVQPPVQHEARDQPRQLRGQRIPGRLVAAVLAGQPPTLMQQPLVGEIGLQLRAQFGQRQLPALVYQGLDRQQVSTGVPARGCTP